MRRLGQGLLWLGASLGVAVGLAWLTGVHPAGWSWILTVGVAKLTLASSLGLMGGGAVCLRLAQREQQRNRLSVSGPSRRDRNESDAS